jgi:tRNA modification GTPase
MSALKAGLSEELVLVSLHNALKYLGEITGETTTEDILSEVFSTFCIGK